MRPPAALFAATTLLCVVAAGCGLGPGESEPGEASLRVTRGFGAQLLAEATLTEVTESDTVVRFLDANAEVETSYGGNFVDAIDGIAGSTAGGGDGEDWFFFVNGYYSEIGAGEARVHAGDRIWWDYRDWRQAYRVPAVVGSFPEPFLHGESGGEPPGVALECVGAKAGGACAAAAAALDEAGIEYGREDVAAPERRPDELRILVGAWPELSADPAVAQLERGPGTSGVYATLGRCGKRYEVELLGADGRPRLRLADGALLAAVRQGEDQPTWVVTGTVADALERAAALLDADALRDRYAVVAGPSGEPLPAPAPDDLAVPDGGSPCG